MPRYLSLLFFTLVLIWCSTTQATDDEEIKVLKNFGENLFRELNQFDSFPDKDSDAINVQNKLEPPVLFSRRRRSFPDKPGEQQVGEFSDKTNPDGIQNNSNDVLPDLSSDREVLNPPETNALISEQIMNRSSDSNKMAVHQSQMVQKSEEPQNNVAGQQPGINLPVETQGNLIGQQQKQQTLVKAESNVQEPIQPPYNINTPQPQAKVQNNLVQQQSGPSQNNLVQQQSGLSQNNLAQQQSVPSQKIVAQQQSAPSQNIVAQQSAQSQNNLPQQQSAQSQNNLAQQQSAQSQNNLPQQQSAQSQNNLAQQQSAQSQNNLPQQQSAQSQNNLAQQQSAQSQNNLAQQQSAQSQNNLAQQQSAQSQNNLPQQQSAQSQNNLAQQQSAQSQNIVAQQQLAPSQNNGLQQPVQAKGLQPQNSLAEQQMPVSSNLGQQQQHPSIQDQSNVLAHHDLEQNSVFENHQQGPSQIDHNSLPLNQQNYPDPNQGRQIIDNGGLYADTQNQHSIDNGGLSADQQKPAFIKNNDQSIADKQAPPTNKPNSPSEFDMINKLHPAYVTGNKPNVKPPGYQPKVYVTSQAVRPGQISVTPSKVDSSSRTPVFMISTLKNLPKEPEHSQESGKPVSDDGWYYNQEIDDSLHQGVTESEKHAGKQMLMSAHHFDIPLGAFAGAKMFNNDLWLKNRKQYLMNKKSETFEPMSMALFYSWIALATLAVLAILTVFRHRHKVTGYVYDLRHWHNGGYVEEGRRLLHNAYA